ncbi:MAG: hypothetical protein KF847_02735 [Pirellulales bacterium]|nr:hypothetical protein [Pirellulales bacterium]
MTWLRRTNNSALVAMATLLAIGTPASGAIIVDDSWADGGRDNGVDPLDADWWYSTASSAIEVSVGSLGLVTGTSGRGIHGTFAAQTLANVGDTLTATFTFRTPATVANSASAGFKIGLFDSNSSALNQDISASSGSPNALYNPVLGYMLDFDLNTATANVQFRERTVASGQLLATTADYTALSSGGAVYAINANSVYTGVFSLMRTASGLDLTGSLDGPGASTTFTASDLAPSTFAFDVLAFHANSNVFGSSPAVGAADNGIDFSNIKVEFSAVPEPSSLLTCGAAAAIGVCAAALRARRR